jgi:hypothetical protein
MARKPLTKEKIAERTKKAQATREAKKRAALQDMGLDTSSKVTRKKATSAGVSIHESIRNLPDTDCFAPPRVRGWINNTQNKLKSMKSGKDSKDVKERVAYTSEKVYIDNLNTYLRTGVYLDSRWGADGQHKVTHVCRGLAYDTDGVPKRTVGVWYPDIGGVYTEEMEKEDYGR